MSLLSQTRWVLGVPGKTLGGREKPYNVSGCQKFDSKSIGHGLEVSIEGIMEVCDSVVEGNVFFFDFFDLFSLF